MDKGLYVKVIRIWTSYRKYCSLKQILLGSFKNHTKEVRMKKMLKKFIGYINQPAITSFGDKIYLPLWKSVLADYLCIFTLGFYKPRKKRQA